MGAPALHEDRRRAFAETRLDDRLDAAAREDASLRALEVFESAAAEVPAYARFLREQGVNASAIRDAADFLRLPATSKENYARPSPLRDLVRGGRLDAGDLFAASSGSTGEPTFWLRSLADEFEVAWRFEQVFHDSFGADRRATLAVVCFALGTWVGGLYTASCCRHLAMKGYPVTTIAPGNNKAEILRVVERLGPQFEQVVLLGYPPFLKDVVDSGIAAGLDWSKLSVRLVTAGEVFSEEWRELLWERVGRPGPVPEFAASLYGTADGGVLANETPLSVCIRRFFARTPDAARQFFGESRLPTLAQYDPTSRYFEAHEGRMLFTADGTMPLVRYDILDRGGITPHAEMLRFLADWKMDPVADLAAAGGSRGARGLPFLHVFGRSFFAVSYYGANIYPENVTVGLERPEIRDWVTGKFVIETPEDADRNRHLLITIELAPGGPLGAGRVAEEPARLAAESIRAELLRLNSEFASYVPAARQLPRIRLLPAGDPDYFPTGVKHRYTRG